LNFYVYTTAQFNHIQIFPNNIVNTMTIGKKAVRPFRDAAALQNFDYRPNFN
jgi:LemA protein